MGKKTIVRIGNHTAELTPGGWKSEDSDTAFFCYFAKHGAGIPKPWFPNAHRSEAEQLLIACLERDMDAEIISIGGCDGPYTDPNEPNALF